MQDHVDPVPLRPKLGAGDLLQCGGDVLSHLGARQGQGEMPVPMRDPSDGSRDVRIRAFGDNRDARTRRRTDSGHKPHGRGRQKRTPPHHTRSAARTIAARIRG